MEYWVGGGGSPHDAITPVYHVPRQGTYLDGGKRRVSFGDGANDHEPFYSLPKRARYSEPQGAAIDDEPHQRRRYDRPYDLYPVVRTEPLDDTNASLNNRSFIVIREHSPPLCPPLPTGGAGASCAMERTESGISISSDTTRHSCDDEADDFLLSDLEAARLVRDHVAAFRRRYRDSRHGRILKALIKPKSRGADFPLDNDALESIFFAANELFFANRLTLRVTWDWSHQRSTQYSSHIVGTTALRRSKALGGYETLIVLSSPILKDTKYNRRLLISTFLHEMIHSYLFVTCGLKARDGGGHTEGFHIIAEIIDEWVGKEHLRLCEIDANLDSYRGDLTPSEDEVVSSDHDTFHRGRTHRPATPRQEDWDGRFIDAQPQWRLDHDEWQWQNQEGFRSRSAHGSGSSYVY